MMSAPAPEVRATFLRLAKAGAAWLLFLLVMSLLATVVMPGNFTIDVFGVASERANGAKHVHVGMPAIVFFLVILPLVGAGIQHFGARDKAASSPDHTQAL